MNSKNLNDSGIKPRTDLNPLFVPAEHIHPPEVDWVGISFGLTDRLLKFYSKCL